MSDLISRSTLIKRFKELKGADTLANMFISDVLTEIKNQPPVEAVPVVHGEWILCSERLPNISRCIVDVGYLMDDGKLEHDVKIVDFEKWQSGFRFIDSWRNDITNNVIAWIPLPDPYKADMRKKV